MVCDVCGCTVTEDNVVFVKLSTGETFTFCKVCSEREDKYAKAFENDTCGRIVGDSKHPSKRKG